MKAKHSEISYELGSENVFFDLGMADAEEKLAKAELAFKINQLIEKRGFKQAEAAKLLKIDQAKISLLHRGRLSGFFYGTAYKISQHFRPGHRNCN